MTSTVTTTPRYLSPLRYPGGKARLAPVLSSIIEKNDLASGHYVEPYAGGAGVALALLFDKVVSDIHINDIDAECTPSGTACCMKPSPCVD
ncbi:MAG: DNA adenine methylase [Sandaracinaceae bacterium]|nr:DNA adenine methylase [Sandaracinaceae bacterium]